MGSILDDLSNLWNGLGQAGSGVFHSLEDVVMHLGSLGVPSFASLPQFIQFLVTQGENPFTFLPALTSHILGKGGDPISVLEELAGGFLSEGPQAYTQKQATKVITPIIATLQQHTQTTSALGSLHQETITKVKQKLSTLRQGTPGAPGLQGNFALALDSQFAVVEKNMATLTGPFGMQLSDPWPVFQDNFAQINQGFIWGLQQVPNMVKAFAIFDMAMITAEAIIDVPITVSTLGIGDIAAVPIEGGVDVVVVAGEIIIIGVWVLGDALIWVLRVIAALAALAIEEIIYQPYQMAKGGKKNVADTGITNEARALIAAGLAKTMCDALGQLWDQATKARNSAKLQRIKATQKFYGCRHHG